MFSIIGGVLLFVFSLSDGYYLSPNYLDYFQAQAFCTRVCSSELAGIVDDFRMSTAAHTMVLQNIEVYGNSDNVAWIGLDGSTIDADGEPTEWLGGEPIDFGSDFVATLHNGECGQLSTQNGTNTTFMSASCATLARPLCNSCEGFIEKYALVAQFSSAADAATACMTRYGTMMASVRGSEEDMAAISGLQDISGNQAIWLGLSVQNETEMEWVDGSMLGYGAEGVSAGNCDPWAHGNAVTSETQCAVVNADGCWEAVDCGAIHAYVLCRKPSELPGDGINWWWDGGDLAAVDAATSYYVLESDAADAQPYASLYGKRWLNEREPFEFELTFTVEESAAYLALVQDSDSAVVGSVYAGVYLTLDRWCADDGWLWLGIDREFGSDLTTLGVEGEGVEWAYAEVPFSDAVDHVLRGSVRAHGNHTIMSAWLDGVEYFNNFELQYQYPHESWSPLLGLWSNGGLIFTSKTLYVSGSPYYAEDCGHFDGFNATGTTTTSDTEEPTTTIVAGGTDTTSTTLNPDGNTGTNGGYRSGIFCALLYLVATVVSTL